MSSKDKQARMQEKFQAVLSTLLREEDNKYCADCEAKGPRWTSWNLGVFICIRCAGIHRNLGVHISKVKSVNLDQWTAEQIASMLAMGNSRAKAIYECNLGENYRRSQSDSAMEQFIRAKYEQRKWIDKSWTPAPITIPPQLIDDEKDKRSKQQGLTEIKLKKESSGNSQTNTTSTSTTKKSTSSSDRKNELDSNNSSKVSSAAEKKPKQPVFEEPVLLDFDDASAPPPTTKAAASTTQNNVIGEDLFDNENFKRMNLNEPTVEMPTPLATTTTTNTAQLNADLGELTLIGGEDLNSRKALGNNSTGPIDKNSILALYNNINNNNSSSANSNLLNFATSTSNPTTNKPSPNHQYPSTNNNFGGFTAANIPTTMTSPNIAAAANQQQMFSPSLFGGANNGITNSHSLFNLSPQINNPPNFGNASSNQPKSGQFNQFNFAPTNNINNLMFPTTTNANKPSGQQQQQPMTNNNAMFNDLNFGPFTTAPTTTSNLNSATSASNTLPNIGNTLVSDLWN